MQNTFNVLNEMFSLSTDAQLFKAAFEDSQKSNAALGTSSDASASAAPATSASTTGEVHGDQVR